MYDKGVVIIGSGNVTHNLGKFDRDIHAKPVDWVVDFDRLVKKAIDEQDHQKLIQYQKIGSLAILAQPEPSHWYPLIYSLGLQYPNEIVHHIYEGFQHGTFSMRCVKIS